MGTLTMDTLPDDMRHSLPEFIRTAPPQLSNLPPELCMQVLGHLTGLRDLARVTRVSSALSALLEQALRERFAAQGTVLPAQLPSWTST
eukprot:1034733-Prymnesium_polylepis.1